MVRLEEKDGVVNLKFTFINLYEDISKKYTAYYSDGKTLSGFDLADVSGGTFALREVGCGGAAALSVGEGAEKKYILYGALSPSAPDIKQMFAEKTETPKYDDEIMATENYFEFDKTDRQENHDTGDNENDGNDRDENVAPESEDMREKQKAKQSGKAFRDENDAEFQPPYYEKVKDRLSKLMKTYPSEEGLCSVVPHSEWVRIPFEKGRHYAVGIIYDRGVPRWICYGVPGRYGEKPAELHGYCSFIPSSLFAPKNNGYWVMFQSATDGNCVSPE
ncbi:MAG: hypothetical protein J5903_02755 [Clostridia bacterium]|nr:hypothetical protein [Clostridia bacterium]